jgi:glycolate oxidase
MAGGLRPSLLELMDRPSIDAVSAYRDLGFPPEAGAALLVQSDRGEAAGRDLDRFASVAGAHGAEVLVSTDPVEAEMLLEARRLVGTAIERLGAFLSDDVCVPLSALVDLIEGVHRISAEHELLITCVGHAGDGNMHPTVIFDRDDSAEVDRARRAFGAVMDLGLRLGGTITGEHGVGLLKREWLERELGQAALRVHHDIKNMFDPRGILNPGKVLAARNPQRHARADAHLSCVD